MHGRAGGQTDRHVRENKTYGQTQTDAGRRRQARTGTDRHGQTRARTDTDMRGQTQADSHAGGQAGKWTGMKVDRHEGGQA